MKRILLLFICLFLTACNQTRPHKIDVNIKNTDGDSLGKIKMEEKVGGIQLKIDLTGLPPGEHGMHIHDKGSCKPPDFLSAGDHYNPDKKEHGLLNPKGSHAGDLPNLVVGEDGKAKVDFIAKGISFGEGKSTLYTKDGTSIVIHENPDDGMSQPAGGSGERIACGEITKNKQPAPDTKK